MFEAFLMELAKVLGFSKLAPDKQGACLIVMKESGLSLLFEVDEQLVPNKVLLSCEICDFPIDRRAEIYEESLKINAAIEETVSIKPDEDKLFLHRRISPEIQEPELDLVVHSFEKQVLAMQKRIEKMLQAAPKRPQIPPSPSSIEIFPYKA